MYRTGSEWKFGESRIFLKQIHAHIKWWYCIHWTNLSWPLLAFVTYDLKDNGDNLLAAYSIQLSAICTAIGQYRYLYNIILILVLDRQTIQFCDNYLYVLFIKIYLNLRSPFQCNNHFHQVFLISERKNFSTLKFVPMVTLGKFSRENMDCFQFY